MQDALRHDGTHEAWLSSSYSADDLSNDREILDAAQGILPMVGSGTAQDGPNADWENRPMENRSSGGDSNNSPSVDWEDWGGGLDLISASLSQVLTYKIKILQWKIKILLLKNADYCRSRWLNRV